MCIVSRRMPIRTLTKFGSCHPPHVKRGYPYGLMDSSEEVFERRLRGLKGLFSRERL